MLGQQLRAEREAQGHSQSEAAEATRLKVQHIEALEKEDFSKVAAPAYAKGFIKLYAEFLEMDPELLLEDYEENFRPKTFTPLQSDDEQTAQRTEKNDFGQKKPPRDWKWPDWRSIEWPFTFSKQLSLRILAACTGLLLLVVIASLFGKREEVQPSSSELANRSRSKHYLVQDPPAPYMDQYARTRENE